MNRWYLLDDGVLPAADNMARDEFLLERAERRGGAPVLRLYSFNPPAVSIGYHQRPASVLDLAFLERNGIDLVRRVTGGRALLHDGELTYAVAAPQSGDGFSGGLTGTFLAIAHALADALCDLGVNASVEGGRASTSAGVGNTNDTPGGHGRPAPAARCGLAAPCLASVSRYEIAVNGRKIAGSAQRRTRNAFLQHGSILLRPATARITEYAAGEWPSLAGRVTSVSEELGVTVDRLAVRSALKRAFASRFSVRWAPLVLAPAELREIERRSRAKRLEFTTHDGGGCDC